LSDCWRNEGSDDAASRACDVLILVQIVWPSRRRLSSANDLSVVLMVDQQTKLIN
jgi:hypothetical protein